MRKVIIFGLKIILVLTITFIVIELILQVIFLSLPQVITQRMPQYPERYGIRFNTLHGAREYPAKEQVVLEINSFSGDLYQLSCLSPKDAVQVTPYQVSYTRDAHGFRNPEPWRDEVNVVVIGDSFTAAESIVDPFWKNLSDSMLVLGLPGSGTLEQKLLYEHFAQPRSPEIVILAFFGGNDLTDNLTFYDLQNEDLSFADKSHQNRNPFEYLVSFHLALFIRDAITQSNTQTCHYPITAQTQPPSTLAFFDRMVSLLTINEDNLNQSEMFSITRDTIVDMDQSVKLAGRHFILMYIPQKAEVYWQYLTEQDKQSIIESLPANPLGNEESVTRDSINANLLAQRHLLQDLATENDILFLDLTPFLEDNVASGQSPYFFADTHWNQIGHDLVGQVLRDFISQSTLDKNPNS